MHRRNQTQFKTSLHNDDLLIFWIISLRACSGHDHDKDTEQSNHFRGKMNTPQQL